MFVFPIEIQKISLFSGPENSDVLGILELGSKLMVFPAGVVLCLGDGVASVGWVTTRHVCRSAIVDGCSTRLGCVLIDIPSCVVDAGLSRWVVLVFGVNVRTWDICSGL